MDDLCFLTQPTRLYLWMWKKNCRFFVQQKPDLGLDKHKEPRHKKWWNKKRKIFCLVVVVVAVSRISAIILMQG